ncbi:MAG: TIGR04282 family arsenosugar biosynthesis glycosyltransferase [bacterium]
MISPANPPPKRAILLFTHSPTTEAQTKPIAGFSMAERVTLYEELISHTLATAGATPYPALVATTHASYALQCPQIAHTFAQRGRNFSERLTAALIDAFELGYEEVVAIGNDCVDLSAADLEAAFGLLQRYDIALGSAADGGVYLIAARRGTLPKLETAFAQCRWQTGHVQGDLLLEAACLGVRTALLGTRSDLDTIEDLMRTAHVHRELRALCRLAQKLFSAITPQVLLRNIAFPLSRHLIRQYSQRPPPDSWFHSILPCV